MNLAEMLNVTQAGCVLRDNVTQAGCVLIDTGVTRNKEVMFVF
jgi:hypothetical protein